MFQEIVKQHFDSGELRSSVRILRFLLLSNAYVIITSMPIFATYRVMVEQIILFVKIVNRYFEIKESSASG